MRTAERSVRNAYRASLWLASEYAHGCSASAERGGRLSSLASRFAELDTRCPWSGGV